MRPGFFRNKKGDSAVFLVVLITLVICGLCYIGLREGLDSSMDKFENLKMNYTASDHSNQILQVYDFFIWYPIIIVFVLLIYAIMMTKNKRDGVYG